MCDDVVNLNISIHAPPRGATGTACKNRRKGYFNSRPSARGDRNGCACRVVGGIFQFTPLREGRLVTQSGKSRARNFNSRPSARGDDATDEEEEKTLLISIHAPPRGATRIYQTTALVLTISIHAPPRGATAKDMQFLQIFCSTLTNQHGLTIVPGNLSRLFW